MSGRTRQQEEPELGLIQHQPTLKTLRNTTIVETNPDKIRGSGSGVRKARTSPSPERSKSHVRCIKQMRKVRESLMRGEFFSPSVHVKWSLDLYRCSSSLLCPQHVFCRAPCKQLSLRRKAKKASLVKKCTCKQSLCKIRKGDCA